MSLLLKNTCTLEFETETGETKIGKCFEFSVNGETETYFLDGLELYSLCKEYGGKLKQNTH